MPILTVIIGGAIDRAIGSVGGAVIDTLKRRWRNKAARRELIQIINESIENTAAEFPALIDVLKSETFVQNIIAPVVIQSLHGRLTDEPESEITRRYIEQFEGPFFRESLAAGTLPQLLQTKQRDLKQAFSAFLSCLRPALYGSEYWRDPIRDQALEETRSEVLRIGEWIARRPVTDAVNIDEARVDAEAASRALESWQQTIGGEHIDRPELEALLQRIREHPSACTLVIGEPGSGKSALFAKLIGHLRSQGMVVFAIKADLLPVGVRTMTDLSQALGLRKNVLDEIEALAQTASVVVLIDQLDAVSEVMDRSSERMRLLLEIAYRFQVKKHAAQSAPPVHVLVSSRPFEASYDARFRSLNAEIVQLELPSQEQVDELLMRLHISTEEIPESLSETLRRPFALRLFVDIFRRGVVSRELIASQLLTTWLKSADFGVSSTRQAVLEFLEQLAGDMTESESLWRPADTYEIQNPQAIQIALASGIVVKENGLVGFSHQAWLDDFQAKNFSTGQALADYAWQRQDGLFARATVLRALQRLRAFDLSAYEQAIDALLQTEATRRHLHHLVVNMVAGQDKPSARERGWMEHIVRSDIPLARRALAQAASHWRGWRKYFRPLMPTAMAKADLRWYVVKLLIAEAPFDANFVIQTVIAYWGADEYDRAALDVFFQSGLWTPIVVKHIERILLRQKLDNYSIVHYAKTLDDHRAAELLKIHLKNIDVSRDDQSNFYGLEEITQRSTSAFAEVLFPWFVHIASQKPLERRGALDAYPSSPNFQWWMHEDREDDIFCITKSVLITCAKEHPHDFLTLIEQFIDVEVAEVQALIAEGFAAGSDVLANKGLDYLLGDSRRMQVGEAYLQDSQGYIHSIEGWSTQVLVRAIVPRLVPEQLENLRAYIESWDPYRREALEGFDVSTRRHFFKWADEKRFPLLAMLPENTLPSRRYRQVREWFATQPDLREKSGRIMVSVVGSPMSAEQMSQASDEDLFRMIDQVPDGTDRRPGRRALYRDGGTMQVARAFAKFGKTHPRRALHIAEHHFLPGRHENVAGELLRVLAEDSNIDAQRVRTLIWKWHHEDFSSEAWRRDAAWSLQDLAKRDAGLIDEDIELLESWIVDDSELTNERVAARLDLEQRNHAANSHQKVAVAPIVFGRNWGRGRILPQDNFALLSAIAIGLLGRPEPDWNGWLSILERHVNRAEDPAIWTALFIFRGQPLLRANRTRAMRLIERIGEKFPEAFLDKDIAYFLWRNRDLFTDSLMKSIRNQWLSSDNDQNRQAAGELLMAAVLVNPEDEAASTQLENILVGPETPERLGALFTAATAWREEAPALRATAHDVLMRFVRQASGLSALAVASAVSHWDPPTADVFTKELLGAITNNSEVLRHSIKGSFTRSLQKLLLSLDFEELILEVAERCTDFMFAEDQPGVQMPCGENFVAIAIALQRSMGPLRSRAMDLYERLLDGEAYGAEKAATASLSRS